MGDALITFHPSEDDDPFMQPTVVLHRTNRERLIASRNHAFCFHSAMYEWVFASGMEIILRDSQANTLAKFLYAPSWFQSGGILAMGNQMATGTHVIDTGEYDRMQQEKEWEHVVVVTLLALLRREREWRYAIAGFIFPLKRTLC